MFQDFHGVKGPNHITYPFQRELEGMWYLQAGHLSKSSVGLAVGRVNQSFQKVSAEGTRLYQRCGW
jgi:hypothetical protein